MSTERTLMNKAVREVMDFVAQIWAADPNEHPLGSLLEPASKEESDQALVDLNQLLKDVRDDLTTLYDGEIAVYLRASYSVRDQLSNWHPLYQEAKALLESRHGVKHTQNMLHGLDR